MIIKEAKHQDGITVVNIYVPNIGTPKHIKLKLTKPKEEIKGNITIVGGLKCPMFNNG